MNTRILMLTLLAAPVIVCAQQPPASRAQAAAPATAKTEAVAPSSFRVSDPDVQRVLRDAAAASEPNAPSAGNTRADTNAPEGFEPLRFRAPRRIDRLKCEGDQCVALTADGTKLYTVTEDGRLNNRSLTNDD